MNMKIDTKRFGPIEIPRDKIIKMEKPVLGFDRFKEFCLIEQEDSNPVMWLQCLENPEVALPIINPLLLFPEYKIEINSQEIAELRVADVSNVEIYAVLTIDEKLEKTTINLLGPILINTENNLGKQLVLVNSKYHLNHQVITIESSYKNEVAEATPALI